MELAAMTLLLVLTVLGDWSYDGFVADPAPTNPSAGVVRRAETLPATRAQSAPPSLSTAAKTKSVVMPPSAPPVAAQMPPPLQRWRLADATGQVWEFHDPERLKEWVKARNAVPPPTSIPGGTSLAVTYPPFFTTSNCASGQCYRGR
jgi:hypothetical protein